MNGTAHGVVAGHGWPRALAVLMLVFSFSACISVPAPGAHFVMKVSKVPTERHQLQGHRGLSTAIRKVAPPPQDDFIFTQGCITVSCQARARPLQ